LRGAGEAPGGEGGGSFAGKREKYGITINAEERLCGGSAQHWPSEGKLGAHDWEFRGVLEKEKKGVMNENMCGEMVGAV